MFHVFLICFLIKNSWKQKKTSTERTHPKPSQVICTRSSDTAGEAVSFANSHDRFSPNRGFQKLRHVCFGGAFSFLVFFQKTRITKIHRSFSVGFSFHFRRGGHFIVVCPTFATTNGSSKFSASWDETKKKENLHVRHGKVLRQLLFFFEGRAIFAFF